MTEYIVTVHLCGGSQAEAADPRRVFGPFGDQPTGTGKERAREFARRFKAAIDASGDSYFLNEMLVVVNPITDDTPEACAQALLDEYD